MKKIIIILLNIILLNSNVIEAKSMYISDIELIGNTHVSKNEIFKNCLFKDSKGILVDFEKLKNNLDNNKLINNYKINVVNNKLKIQINEKTLFLILEVDDKNNDMFFEISQDFKIVSVNKVHEKKLPHVIINRNDVIKNKVSNRVQKLMKDLLFIKIKYISFFKIIKKIDLTSEISKIYLNDNTIVLWDEKLISLINLANVYKLNNYRLNYDNGICQNNMVAFW